jgi:methylamine---glutamate N-methyltransferase subunit A
MCGIAGRILREPGAVGLDLEKLMQAQAHRGSDSTGYALYGTPRSSGYVCRAVAADRSRLEADLAAFHALLTRFGSDFVEDPTWDTTGQTHVSVRAVISDPADGIAPWLAAADALPGIAIQSVGRSLEIVKDLGDAAAVAGKHRMDDFVGTHGIANARMATESRVSPTASHPFWARPFPDIAIVHNGQLTNYYLLKERLERRGYRFMTDNDSELIAVWISDRLSHGLTLEEALHQSIDDLDGVFTYLIATADQMGTAKDRWAIKPLSVVEDAGGMATATEEQAVRWVYPDESDVINLDGPSQVVTWDVRVPAPV